MAIDTTLVATGAVSVAVFVTMGIVVLWRAEARLLPRAFGIWLITLGLGDAAFYLAAGLGVRSQLFFDIASTSYFVIIAAAIVAVVAAMPRFFDIPSTIMRGPALTWFMVGVAIQIVETSIMLLTVWSRDDWQSWLFAATRIIENGTILGALLWFPSLVPRLDRVGTRVMLLLAAIGGAFFFQNGSSLIWWLNGVHAFPNVGLVTGLGAGAALLILGRWASMKRGTSAIGWAAVSIFLGFAVMGEIGAVAGGGALAGWWNTMWVISTSSMVGYALLHGKVLRLDLTFRWTIHRGFLPGMAVAVFFIVSEGAQEFFGDRAGNAYIGIMAAGLLLVGLGPIQGAAQRLADRAVPGLPTVRPFVSNEEIYRHAFRAAALDGTLSQEEEQELAVLQDRLGLPASKVLAIRLDAQRSIDA